VLLLLFPTQQAGVTLFFKGRGLQLQPLPVSALRSIMLRLLLLLPRSIAADPRKLIDTLL